MAPDRARYGPYAPRALQAPGERVPRRRVLLLRPGTSAGPILALLRGPRKVRPQPRRPAHAGLAALQQDHRQRRERRDLSRDIPRGARKLRGGLRQHACLRAGEGDRTRQGDRGQGDGQEAPDARGERTSRALAGVAATFRLPCSSIGGFRGRGPTQIKTTPKVRLRARLQPGGAVRIEVDSDDGGEQNKGRYAHGRPLSLLACSRRGQPPAIRSSNLRSSLPSGPSVEIP